MLQQAKEEATILPDEIPERLKLQSRFYGRNATRHMRKYFRLKTLQILAGGCIPLVAILAPDSWVRGTSGLLGAVVAAAEALIQFRQY